ncbi:MAG TPA: two-component regulator propeller domain-containing protein, partial [Lysobacter sp.]
MLLSFAAAATEPRRLAHYVHQRWIEGSEAPVPVVGIAQGHDGFLWLATGDGLFRFDGLRFEPIEPAEGGHAHDLPSAVLVTRSGDVWTSFETSRRFAIYRNGALRIVDAPAAPSRIVQMVEGADGSIWALTANYDAQVLRYRDGRWRTYGAADGLPDRNAANMLVAADGALWIACDDAVARLAPGAGRFGIVRPTVNGRVTVDPAGRVWLVEKDAAFPITGPGGRGAPPATQAPHRLGGSEIRGTPLFDRAGNLWRTTRYDGVKRLAADASPDAGVVAEESFARRDGLSSDVTSQALEDREGNIWIGTEDGLDKFRPATLIAERAFSSPATFGDKLLDASDGSVYVGQARTLYRVRPGGQPEAVLHDVVEPESLCEAPDGAIWIGLATQILVWADGGIRQAIARPDTAAHHNHIYDCAFDAHGDYWISAAGSGVHRYRQGQWDTPLEPGDLADFYPTTMVRTPAGGVVVQSGDKLVWIEDAGRRSTRLDFGAGDLKVLTLYTAGDDVYVAGAFGLSLHRRDRVQTAWAAEVSQRSRINGIVRTPQGDTWLAYPKSLARLRPQELERAFADGAMPTPALSLGPGDGLVSRPHSHSQRAMVRGGDGRLWIATETGTLWMDPAHIVRNATPPGVAIRSVDADGRRWRDPAALKLPAATSKIEIDFAVLSFSDQPRVRVRYMLEGFDRRWVDPGSRRQAFYTNLPPGRYRFRVIAANNDGVWNRSGATLAFEIPPAFFQSAWFLVLCAVLVLAGLWAAYRLRVAQIAGRIRRGL